MESENRVWLVAYIVRDYISQVQKDLHKHGFDFVKVYIPTVKLLKKQFRGKNVYEEVPLLFNYGFFSIPFYKACETETLMEMRKKIPCIYSWVKDPMSLVARKPTLRIDNTDLFKPDVAVISEEEIITLLKVSEYTSVFSEDSIDKLKAKDFLILKGYPYEGIPAEVIKIDKNKKEVRVKLLLENIMHDVSVHFDNVYYTVYSDYDAESPMSTRDPSLEEMTTNKRVDKLYASISYE